MNREPLYIMVVSDEMHGRGGACVVQADVAEHLAARGHQVELLYLRDGPYLSRWAEITSARSRLDQVREPRVHDRYSGLRNRVAVLVNWMLVATRAMPRRRHQRGIVYANGHGDLMPADYVARLTGAPLVLHLHSPPWNLSRLGRRKRAALLGADAYICVSHAMRNAWIQAGLDPDRTLVVHNGVDTDVFSPLAAEDRSVRREADLGVVTKSDFVVGYIGRVEEIKGVHVLADAMRDDRLSDALLAIKGFSADPTDLTDYEKAIVARSDSQRLLALESGPNPSRFYGACDVIAVPSNYEEPNQHYILEAMSCGVPVVTTRVGGCLEGLTDELRKLATAPGDGEALSEALAAVRARLEAGEDIGGRARQHMVEAFSIERTVQSIEGVLEGTLES